MAKVIAVANQKGGVGKTTTSINLSSCTAYRDKRVLLIDLDPQGNATTGLGVDKREMKSSIYDVIINEVPIKEVSINTMQDTLYLCPSSISLAGAEIELVSLLSRENRLKYAISEVQDDYDYIFIDCPPSLGMLTVKALSISDGVVIPMQCEFYSLEGMSQLLNTVKKIRQLYNPELQIVGILLTMYNGRLTLTGQVVAELRKYYSDLLFKVPISRTVRLSEAPGYGEPICYHDPYCKGSLEYAAVAKELQLRI